jgi:glutaredoxin-dependent peroxiredoxin
MKLTTGQTAPDFTMYDTEKNKVSLSDFKGKNVLLLFFPQAFTGVCTKELCSIRDHIAQYEAVNAQVIGISVDSLFTLNKYKADQQLNFPLLSDFNKNVSEAYGCLYETFAFEMKGVSKRSAFIINKDGVIEYAEVLENAGELPDFEAIEKTLAGLS